MKALLAARRDKDTLERIQNIVNGTEWEPVTTALIAGLLHKSGYPIKDDVMKRANKLQLNAMRNIMRLTA